MTNRSCFGFAVAAAAFVAAMAFTSPARAVSCDAITKLGPGGTATTTPAPPVIYVSGSSPLKQMFATLAPALFNDPTRPMTIAYRVTPSCTATAQILSGVPMATNTTTEAVYWDPNSLTTANGTTTANEEKCTIPNGQLATIGTSDVFAQTCGLALQGIPAGFADFLGPVQAAVFAVNKGSKEQSINALGAYLAIGSASLAPWTDPSFIFRRNETSGTQLLVGAAIGVDAKRWAGVDSGSSDKVFSSLAGLTTQAEMDKGIGIVLADFGARPELRTLAYQHTDQRCAYRPDVAPLDMKNVREGRYAIWGNLHIFTQVDASGLAKDVRARDVVAFLLGTQAGPGNISLLRTQVQTRNVPPCAMKVRRSAEMGPMSPFKHPRSCGCAYDKEATGTSTCKACTTNGDCGQNESCNFNFCEAQ